MTGLVILVLALAASVAFGLYRRGVDGRFSAADDVHGEKAVEVRGRPRPSLETTVGDRVSAAVPTAELGERATLVQFSSAFCAPCRTTRAVLSEIAGTEDGVRHVEVDAEKHLDLVRALDVRRTPTTFVLDADGRELVRAAGAPRKQQVLDVLPPKVVEVRGAPTPAPSPVVEVRGAPATSLETTNEEH